MPFSALTMFAGSSHSHGGSSGEYMCIDPHADYMDLATGNNDGGLIYQVEYETTGYGISAFASLNNFEVPCAVCVRSNAEAFLYPMRTDCPALGTVLFSGGVIVDGWLLFVC
jgi:hypothetical protein